MDETKYGFWFPPDVSTHGVQIDQLIDIAHFTRTQPTMSRELLTAACKSYFVEM